MGNVFVYCLFEIQRRSLNLLLINLSRNPLKSINMRKLRMKIKAKFRFQDSFKNMRAIYSAHVLWASQSAIILLTKFSVSFRELSTCRIAKFTLVLSVLGRRFQTFVFEKIKEPTPSVIYYIYCSLKMSLCISAFPTKKHLFFK